MDKTENIIAEFRTEIGAIIQKHLEEYQRENPDFRSIETGTEYVDAHLNEYKREIDAVRHRLIIKFNDNDLATQIEELNGWSVQSLMKEILLVSV